MVGSPGHASTFFLVCGGTRGCRNRQVWGGWIMEGFWYGCCRYKAAWDKVRDLGTPVTGAKYTLSLGLGFPSCRMDWFVHSFSGHKLQL